MRYGFALCGVPQVQGFKHKFGVASTLWRRVEMMDGLSVSQVQGVKHKFGMASPLVVCRKFKESNTHSAWLRPL